MTVNGFRLFPAALDASAQAELVATVAWAFDLAPLRRQTTPFGKPMSVAQTNFGPLGWISDEAGYRYAAKDPLTGAPWPAAPPQLTELWTRFVPDAPMFDACLVNHYPQGARMGLHLDRDEADLSIPVLSISLGDTAIFRLGGPQRSDPTRTARLASGDVCVLAGEARRSFHGVDRVLSGSSRTVPGGGRINLTLRRAQA